MNLYQVIAFLILIIFLGREFNLAPSIEHFANGIANIPHFENRGSRPFISDLAVRMMYLIALVGIIKVIFGKKENSE